jgi:hypothetical protein
MIAEPRAKSCPFCSCVPNVEPGPCGEVIRHPTTVDDEHQCPLSGAVATLSVWNRRPAPSLYDAFAIPGVLGIEVQPHYTNVKDYMGPIILRGYKTT